MKKSMTFDLATAVSILERTPQIVTTLLEDLSTTLIHQSEGPESWTAFDVVGHLIHGERTDWIPRAKLILTQRNQVTLTTPPTFIPFDRFAQFEDSQGKMIAELLHTFSQLRQQNIVALHSLNIQPSDFELPGIHPELGLVTLGQLLATWVTHDLNHIGQIVQVIARQYTDDVGPWKEYIGIL